VRDIFVVAGNHAQAQRFLDIPSVRRIFDFEFTNKMVHIVDDVRELDMVHGARVITYGTWAKRKDAKFIEALIEPQGNQRLTIV